jgi:hypothetical protein
VVAICADPEFCVDFGAFLTKLASKTQPHRPGY